MKVEDLEEIGLSKSEARIFLTLTRLGSTTVGKLATDSGIHRRNTYDVLESLVQKGLVGYVIRNDTKVFEATSPLRLLDIIKEERVKLENKWKKLKSLLPDILLQQKLTNEKQDVKIYRGIESRKIIFEDILNTTKQNLVLGAHTPSSLSRRYMNQWHRRRSSLGIIDKMIFNKPDLYAKELSKLPFTQIRFMPKSLDSNTAINIYGNKVVILLWSNGQPITILIDNENIAKDFKEYFNLLWNISKK